MYVNLCLCASENQPLATFRCHCRRGFHKLANNKNLNTDYFSIQFENTTELGHNNLLLNKCEGPTGEFWPEVMAVGTFRLDYEYEIEYEHDFSILVFRLHIITTHTHFIP